MRLIGLLVTLAVLGYVMTMYLGSSPIEADGTTAKKPAEYIDETKQSMDAVNEAMRKQQEQLKRNH